MVQCWKLWLDKVRDKIQAVRNWLFQNPIYVSDNLFVLLCHFHHRKLGKLASYGPCWTDDKCIISIHENSESMSDSPIGEQH